MITLMRVVSFPFMLLPVFCTLIVYGSDEAERLMDAYNEFFRDL
jgi:hypothetical protein